MSFVLYVAYVIDIIIVGISKYVKHYSEICTRKQTWHT